MHQIKVSHKLKRTRKAKSNKDDISKLSQPSPEELDKLKSRQARFESSESSLLKSAEHIEKLKQRQARFGTFESKALQNIEEEEKKAKRAAKFGIPTSNEEQKKQLRAARFNTK